MKKIQRLFLCTFIISTTPLLTACGGDNDSSNSASTTSVDGPTVELTAQDENFSPSKNADNSLQRVSSPTDHQFTASKAAAIQFRSVNSDPCHINIYSRFRQNSAGSYLPDPTTRVMQIDSATCDFSGMLYVMHHWEALLVEVIIIRQTEGSSQINGATYYKVTLPADPISLDVN